MKQSPLLSYNLFFAGPPPLAKDIIDAIPKVEISQQQVDTKLQCSVCWEDFLLKEVVNQLPCLHVYHETCIRPWLELHGTCPICRQNLANNEESNIDNEENSENSSAEGNPYSTLQRLFQAVGSGNMNPSSSGSSTPFQSTPQGSNDNMM